MRTQQHLSCLAVATLRSATRLVKARSLREVYDFFQANKGRVISFTRPSAYITKSLVDYYGLDLRRIG